MMLSHTGDIDCPTSAKSMAKKSAGFPLLDPAMIPRGTQRITAKSVMQSVSFNVHPILDFIKSRTGIL